PPGTEAPFALSIKPYVVAENGVNIITIVRSNEALNVKQKGPSMIATLLKQRIGGASEARMAEGAFLVAACVFPALISFWLLTMQLTTWQLLVSMVATASLGFQLLVLSFLCRVLRRKHDAS